MDTSTYPNVPLAARVDFNELDRERSLFEDIAWFDKHPEREWRCRRSWCFERMTAQRRPPEFGVVWLVLHRTEVYQGRRYLFQSLATFDPCGAVDALCARIADAEFRHYQKNGKWGPMLRLSDVLN